ncbi:MAG: hypothetical protein HEP71_09820 [Roseivirga sp.]|nr:hypothetical protein [Roseivirga sp.]
MKRLLALIFLLTISGTISGQINKSKELITGRWDLIETIEDTTHGFEPLLDLTTEDPETTELSDTRKDEVSFFFTSKGEFQELRFGHQYRSSYRFLTNKVVIIGITTFQIFEITEERLKIQRYDDDGFQVAEPDILIFEKSDKPFKLIKEYEPYLTYHQSGQKKEEGTYHNGYLHGTWKEWHPNGLLKSSKNFTEGRPTGIWKTWNEAGKLIKETNHGG